eukprot:754356-Hanusia_phi.AAC.1
MLRPAPDGRRVAAWSAREERVRVWEVETGRCQELEVLQGAVNDLSWGQDGMSLASLSGSGAVRVWDVETGEVLRSLNAAGSSRRIGYILMSRDERLLIFEGNNKIKTYNRMRSHGSL